MAAASPAVPMATTKQAMSAMAGAPGVDRVFEAYLAMQKALGATQQGDAPVDVAKLIEAARAIAKESSFARVVETAAAMQGKPIAEQRNLFKALSDAVIAVARSDPPSAAVAPKLYVAYCPMAPGDGGRWLQTTQEIANPYFATRMKECGSIEQALATAPARK